MPRPLRDRWQIYVMIAQGRETQLLRNELRTLFAPRGLGYHHPGQQNHMFDRDDMFNELVRKRVFEEIRSAFALAAMEEEALVLV